MHPSRFTVPFYGAHCRLSMSGKAPLGDEPQLFSVHRCGCWHKFATISRPIRYRSRMVGPYQPSYFIMPNISPDMTTMCPKWFNIKRGMMLCMILGGWALCPWIIIESGQTFLSFMGAYAIFMAPFAGILCCDYWIVKRRKYDVPALYDPRGIYYYKVSVPDYLLFFKFPCSLTSSV